MVLLGRQAIPLDRLNKVLRHALAVFVVDSHEKLSLSKALFGSFAKPLARDRIISFDTVAGLVALPQCQLSIRIALLSSLEEPLYRGSVVLHCTHTICKTRACNFRTTQAKMITCRKEKWNIM